MNKNDFILIGMLLIMCIASLFIIQSCSKEGSSVLIKQDGLVYGSFSLAENRVIRIPAEGKDYNVVVIEYSKVYVSEADCPDGICARHGKIHRTGEAIICLPHKLSLTIIKNEADTSKEAADTVIDGVAQ